MFLKGVSLFGALAGASVTVRKTSQGPTGYEVTFRYENSTAGSVTVAGGMQPFTDAWHAVTSGSARYDPHNYKPGWFPANGVQSKPGDLPYIMKNSGNGSWTYTTPLPSGTYNYAFVVDCPKNSTCGINSGHYVIDRDVPPFQNVEGQQIQSTFQVPFDAEFQSYPEMNLDFDYALPVAKEHRGSVHNVNYTQPGSVFPAKDIHDCVVYLPPGYANTTSKQYPVLYLSHGGGGDAQDWQNLAQTSNIMDRLILEKYIAPTIVVMPSFYNIAPEYAAQYGGGIGLAPSAPVVRENYMRYLFPFIESTFSVSTSPSDRAFAGLSLGGRLTYEMYINATSYFSYFGIFSGATFGGANSYINSTMLASNPELGQKGLYTSAGLYDFALGDIQGLEAAFQGLGIGFKTRTVPFGWHAWNTWADCLWWFGREALWGERPSVANPRVAQAEM